MPELPRISGDKAIKVFKKLGFYEARQKGSHVIMRRKDKGCVIPRRTNALPSEHLEVQFDRQASPLISSLRPANKTLFTTKKWWPLSSAVSPEDHYGRINTGRFLLRKEDQYAM